MKTRRSIPLRRKKLAAVRELIERHALVKPRQHFRMRRLQAHGHLQLCR